MILVDAENDQLLFGCRQIGFRVLLAVVRDFQLAFGDRALLVKDFGSLVLRPRQSLVVDRFQVLIEGVGYVGALHLHQQLALGDKSTDLSVNSYDSSGSYGDERDLTGN